MNTNTALRLDEAYAALDLPPGADVQAVKKAWRQRAKATHPDHGQTHATQHGAVQDFLDAKQAYEFLCKTLEAQPLRQPQRTAAAPPKPRTITPWRLNLRRQPVVGDDVRLSVTVSLERFIDPAPLAVDLPTGKRSLVRIPKGLMPGGIIRLKGLGHPGKHGGQAGDAYVTLGVKSHDLYRLVGRDIHTTVPLRLKSMRPGDAIVVPTPAGPVRVLLPNDYRPGHTLRLAGRGLNAPKGQDNGDLYVTPKITSEEGFRHLLDQFVASWVKPDAA